MGFSSCGTWTQLWLTYPSAQAQSVWYMGLVALRHVESSQTRDGTCVICIGNWILLPLSHQGSPHLALLFVPIFALPTVSHAHSHILYLGISCLIFKASSNLTFSGKPSMVAPGRIHSIPFSPLRNDYSCFCYYLSAYLLILGVSHPGPKAASPAGPGQGCRADI